MDRDLLDMCRDCRANNNFIQFYYEHPMIENPEYAPEVIGLEDGDAPVEGHETQPEPETDVGEDVRGEIAHKHYVDLDSESESIDGYESAEDGPYRPRFGVDETDSEEDMKKKVAANKKGKRKVVKSQGEITCKKRQEKTSCEKGEGKITCKG